MTYDTFNYEIKDVAYENSYKNANSLKETTISELKNFEWQ